MNMFTHKIFSEAYKRPYKPFSFYRSSIRSYRESGLYGRSVRLVRFGTYEVSCSQNKGFCTYILLGVELTGHYSSTLRGAVARQPFVKLSVDKPEWGK